MVKPWSVYSLVFSAWLINTPQRRRWTAFQNKIGPQPTAVGSDAFLLWLLTYFFSSLVLPRYQGAAAISCQHPSLPQHGFQLCSHGDLFLSWLMSCSFQLSTLANLWSFFSFRPGHQTRSCDEAMPELLWWRRINGRDPTEPKYCFIFRRAAWPVVPTGATGTGLIWAAGQRSAQPGGSIWLVRWDPWDHGAKGVYTWCCKYRTY